MRPFPNEHLVVSCLTVIEEDLDDEVSNVWMLLIIAHYNWQYLPANVNHLQCTVLHN